jgi:glycosyltransferase involved in cell wall biosynthesis
LSKKIALVADSTWNIYNFRQNIIQKLIEEGHQVIVLAPLDEYITYKDKYPELKHVDLRQLVKDGINPVKDLLLIFELFKKYKAVKPDLIIHYTHKPNIFGSIAAKLCGIKSIAVVTNLGYDYSKEGWLNYILRLLYKFTAGKKELVIFENCDDMNLFKDNEIITAKNAAYVNGCGVDTSYYQPVEKSKNDKQIVFTFIGQLLKDKGVVEFANAAKYLKIEKKSKVKFQLIGAIDPDNPSSIEKDNLKEWIDRGYIDYKGFIPDVRPSIASSDCIVLPSYREGLSRIIIEAMSMGKPVITSNTPGCRQTVINGVNGFLIPVKDEDALRSSMQNFMELDAETRINMGEKGREMVFKKFDSKLIANNFMNLISTFL